MANAKKKRKQRRNLIIIAAGVGLLLLALVSRYLSNASVPVMQPAGPIAAGQKQLMVLTFMLMLIVVLPVFALAFGFAWRYRESNAKADYKPNWDHNRLIEVIWWLIPTALIGAIAVITWQATHKYDPYKPLASSQAPLTVQVVALDWRWLFMYPDYHVVSINELHLPVSTPVKFEITADAPMNSFWIPQLGGQVYAMPGMSTVLHLQADRQGLYYGSSANISGQGFANMHFTTVVSSKADFTAWAKANHERPKLTKAVYSQLAKPTQDQRVVTYSHPDHDLYDTIINKYMSSKNSQMGDM